MTDIMPRVAQNRLAEFISNVTV